ncbi:MAG: hypothetical protein ACRDD7_14335 [Peptostreptococcaceae bacterium]
MNIYFNFKPSKKNKKHKILDLLNFNDLLFDNDILLYDENDNNYACEDYDYIITDDVLNYDDESYKDDSLYHL